MSGTLIYNSNEFARMEPAGQYKHLYKCWPTHLIACLLLKQWCKQKIQTIKSSQQVGTFLSGQRLMYVGLCLQQP